MNYYLVSTQLLPFYNTFQLLALLLLLLNNVYYLTYTKSRQCGPKVTKKFSTPNSSKFYAVKFVPLINIEMPTVIGILTFISRLAG